MDPLDNGRRVEDSDMTKTTHEFARRHSTMIATPFQNQGHELLVFELTKQDERNYLHLSVRGLYKYVLKAITSSNNNETTTTAVMDAIIHSSGAPTNDNTPSIPPPQPRRARAATITGRHINNNNNITYRERLGGYLHPRDMRRLVTPFSNTNEPELIVRRHCMLLNFDPLRAIILRDRLLVLVPAGADSIILEIETRVRGGAAEVENSIFGHNDIAAEPPKQQQAVAPPPPKSTSGNLLSGWLPRKGSRNDLTSTPNAPNATTSGPDPSKRSAESEHSTELDDDLDDSDDDDNNDEWHELMEGRDWIDLPFELQCAEAILHVVGKFLTEETAELESTCSRYMQRLLHPSHTDDPLTIVRVVKDAVQLMTGRVEDFCDSLNRLLNDDEDMALMNLSRLLSHPERFIQPVPQQILDEESDEPELILESNLQVGLSLLNVLKLLRSQITNAKELIDQRQDATRNKLLYANMVISVFSLCTALASLVGSFMGMNIPVPGDNVEGDNDLFNTIAYVSVGMAILLCLLIMLGLRLFGILPRVRGYRSKE